MTAALVVITWLLVAAADGSWLDAPPRPWNAPAVSVPEAPPQLPNELARCRTHEVGPTGPEAAQLVDRGWRLEDYWPPVTRGQVVIETALANYDGMCRPLDFNVFVFSRGQYAGTLSPVNMHSREDGTLLSTPARTIRLNENGLTGADFIRYAPTDPLCCPSRGTTHVLYRVGYSTGQPVVVPIAIGPAQPGVAQLPTRLPSTGVPPSDTGPG